MRPHGCGAVVCLLVLLVRTRETVLAEKPSPSQSTEKEEITCQFASLKCSYRTGCGNTLKSYLIECGDLINNKTNECSEGCKNTLVGLTSTPEGQSLMECQCSDDACRQTKQLIQACRDSVLYATRSDTIVSCSEARWICLSDAECGKALEFYNLFCRAMFKGRLCTERCKNSLSILRRQKKAAKLEECHCAEDEYLDAEFKCADVKRNMNELCYSPQEEGDDVNGSENDQSSLDNELTSAAVTSSALPLVLISLMAVMLTGV